MIKILSTSKDIKSLTNKRMATYYAGCPITAPPPPHHQTTLIIEALRVIKHTLAHIVRVI